jgi:hypothetical protein
LAIFNLDISLRVVVSLNRGETIPGTLCVGSYIMAVVVHENKHDIHQFY